MSEWQGGAAAGRLQPEDDATREARHEVLATLLAAYVDGELPPETMAQIDAHLLGCGRCRREVTVHQSLATRLSRVARPAVSAAFDDRLRAAIASAPIASAPIAAEPVPSASIVAASIDGTATMAASRRRWLVGLVSVVVVMAAALVFTPRTREPDIAALQPAPLVVTAPIPLLSLVAADFLTASARDLPGRARDLETVRGAVPFSVEPLRRADLQLVAAWTTELDGEVAAVLAYKWRDALVMQYVFSDAWLFRSLTIRGAFAAGQSVGTDASGVGMLAWSSGQGSTVVVADQRWPALVALHPRAH
ncbi:zf-HC2 domain-containing protein [Gemmatimonas groenlandica]|uniref:Zf-HC2 domain-containing protein n=1 Tax=Gemmatimonas groenlandica TaxID=2732249 RepID=A0A6M4IP28_9BACT|nr:zf-HC2 domain-containing protein [Gemmatimonas groenlandica]QJR35267.1 zf-HC2 domain-containing protein [Gemmatimonas groenlandica]